MLGHQTGMNKVYAKFAGVEGDTRLEKIYRQAIPELSLGKVQGLGELSEKVEAGEDRYWQLEADNLKLHQLIEKLTIQIRQLSGKDIDLEGLYAEVE